MKSNALIEDENIISHYLSTIFLALNKNETIERCKHKAKV